MGILPWHSYLCKFSREKIWLYVTCIKITKYPSNTIMFGFLIFKKYIFFSLLCVCHTWSYFHLKFCSSDYQGNI
jgi:hypothetical protein